MNNILVNKVAAFTHDGKGGNAAGVVLAAESISSELRQSISRSVGYSETAFVEGSIVDGFKLEFFTPKRQIDICGHATVAAFSLMFERGIIKQGRHKFTSTIGQHEVEVASNSVGLWQKAKFQRVLEDLIEKQSIADSLGINLFKIISEIKIASNGSPFALIQVNDSKQLSELQPKLPEISEISKRLNLVGYYVFSRHSKNEFEARMFAPAYGISEESATGMGAGALVLSLNRDSAETIHILQGHLMYNPSPAILNINQYGVDEVLVSGAAISQESVKYS